MQGVKRRLQANKSTIMADRRESVMSMIQLGGETDTSTARHMQWRKLSRKRRRTLIKRALTKLEQEAGGESLRFGSNDYRHVQSLVYSDLPFNPNGHHCSCNCLDEVQDDPDLEVYGWNYGRLVKSPEGGYYGDHEEEGDDVLLSDYATMFSDVGSPEKGPLATRHSRKEGTRDSLDGARNNGASLGDLSARSSMGGSLELRLGSEAMDVSGSPRKGITAGGSWSVNSFKNQNGSSESVSRALTERVELDKEKTLRSIHSGLDSARSRPIENRSRTGSRKACYCDGLVLGGSTARRSIVSVMSRASSRTACSKCKHLFSAIDKFRHLDSGRQITLAKNEGLLRSKIFGLRQQLKQYNEFIRKDDYLTIQNKVKRKLQIRDAQQKKALGLSDRLKLMKVEELLYKKNNEMLKKRLASGEGMSEDTDSTNEEQHHEDYDQNSSFRQNSFNRSPRKTGRSQRATGLAAVLEEDEEDLRESLSSAEKRPRYFTEKPASYDETYEILFVNHSDNEAESKSRNNTDLDNYDDGSEDDALMQTWPAYKRDLLKLGLWSDDWKRSAASKLTGVLKGQANASPVRRIVHRLDSGLSYGKSSLESELPADDSFSEIKERLDNKKIAGSQLSEEEYYKPLTERQKSFGEEMKEVIKEEITRKASLSSRKAVDQGCQSEDEKIKENLRQEMVRRSSLSQIEKAREKFDDQSKSRDDDLVIEQKEKCDNGEEGGTSGCMFASKSSGMVLEEAEKRDKAGTSGADFPSPPRFVDLSTLRTLAQKHQTLRSLRTLEEDKYEVSSGVEALNTYRKKEAKAKVQSQERDEEPDSETRLPLSARERKFSIPSPENKQSVLEGEMMENDKKISRLNFEYDMMRDLRFLILNQNMNRAFTWSYLKPAPPYLKKKWQNRIKRGFLRGVKEQKLNEVQLEKVEDVTLKSIDRSQIHKVTLTNAQKRKNQSADRSESRAVSESSRMSGTLRQSSMTSADPSDAGYTLPPLKLPSSRESSPTLTNYDRRESMAAPDGTRTLKGAFRRLSIRHKFVEKTSLMRNVIKLSSNSKNEVVESMDFPVLATDRSGIESESQDGFTSRLKQQPRRHSIAMQNFASSDVLSGRLSVNSGDKKRRFSLMQPITEY